MHPSSDRRELTTSAWPAWSPGPPSAPRKILGEMAQSFRTSSCFVGEYFNWLKLKRVHPGKRGGVHYTQTSGKKEYAVLNDDPGRHHHEGDREKPNVAQVHT